MLSSSFFRGRVSFQGVRRGRGGESALELCVLSSSFFRGRKGDGGRVSFGGAEGVQSTLLCRSRFFAEHDPPAAGRAAGARAGGAVHPPLSLLRPGRGEQCAALRGGALVRARARRVTLRRESGSFLGDRNPVLGTGLSGAILSDLGLPGRWRGREASMPGRWRGRAEASTAGRCGKPPNPHSPPNPCYTCYMCYMGLTRQAAEPSLSPRSLLYVLYVLYGSYKASH